MMMMMVVTPVIAGMHQEPCQTRRMHQLISQQPEEQGVWGNPRCLDENTEDRAEGCAATWCFSKHSFL